jgi:hypothetical protein
VYFAFIYTFNTFVTKYKTPFEIFAVLDVTQRLLLVDLIQDVSIQHICPIDRLSGNVGNYQSTTRNIPEEQRRNLRRGGSLKSLKTPFVPVWYSGSRGVD